MNRNEGIQMQDEDIDPDAGLWRKVKESLRDERMEMMEKIKLELCEQETAINFNKADVTATIFTCEKIWQNHLEEKLGLKPVSEDGYGGKEYELPKRLIRPPRASRKLSGGEKEKLTARLSEGYRQKGLKTPCSREK